MTIYSQLADDSWDYAIIYIKGQAPIFIERKSCTIEAWDSHINFTVVNGPHPTIDKAKADSRHSVRISEIISISYFTEKSQNIELSDTKVMQLNP